MIMIMIIIIIAIKFIIIILYINLHVRTVRFYSQPPKLDVQTLTAK